MAFSLIAHLSILVLLINISLLPFIAYSDKVLRGCIVKSSNEIFYYSIFPISVYLIIIIKNHIDNSQCVMYDYI